MKRAFSVRIHSCTRLTSIISENNIKYGFADATGMRWGIAEGNSLGGGKFHHEGGEKRGKNYGY